MKSQTALIFAVIATVLLWVPVVGLILAVIGLVGGILARHDKESKALAAIVMSTIVIAIQVLIFVGIYFALKKMH